MKRYPEYMGLDQPRLMALLANVWRWRDAEARRAFLLLELALLPQRTA